MKIYTKTGDDGSTGLVGGMRVPKSDVRIECYGSVDELNAALGWAVIGAERELSRRLAVVQNELFVIGSHLATPPEKKESAKLPSLDEASVMRLEGEMDLAENELPALRNFVLPGGTETAARLHVARTVCRRVERLVVGFGKENEVEGVILIYLNRLSDWLFVQARLANARAGVADVPWVVNT